MLYIYSSNIHTGRFEEFQRWVSANKEKFAAARPKTWVLRDIYLTVFGLGNAHVEIHWDIDGYESFDIARSTAEGGGPFFKLLTKIHSFLDPATGKGRLLKDAGAGEAVVVDAAR